MQVKVTNNSGFDLPKYAHDGDACIDLRASFTCGNKVIVYGDNNPVELETTVESQVVINPGERALIPTGLSIALPSNTEFEVRPRSGLALKSGITVLNTPGTVDSNYRGDIGVILINHSNVPFTVVHGMKIAQGLVQQYDPIRWESVTKDKLSSTDRNSDGFGSSGLF